jgi:hypothetical protein
MSLNDLYGAILQPLVQNVKQKQQKRPAGDDYAGSTSVFLLTALRQLGPCGVSSTKHSTIPLLPVTLRQNPGGRKPDRPHDA